MAHNTIYEKLTADPNDLVGALAYIIYKKHKVEFCKSKPGGPSEEDLDSFHAVASLQTSIDSYRSQAEALASNFLTVALDEIAERTETETRQDMLYKHVETVHSGLQAQLTTVTTGLQSQLTSINDTLGAKRTPMGWVRDVGGNLAVNMVTIFAIGSIVLGYKFLSDLQQSTEQKVGLNNPAAQAKPPAPASGS